jgi:hypothetical protein
MLAEDATSVSEDLCTSACGELANMVTGRLDAWFKERALPSRCSFPESHVTLPSESALDRSENEGLTTWFTCAENGLSFALAVKASELVSEPTTS